MKKQEDLKLMIKQIKFWNRSRKEQGMAMRTRLKGKNLKKNLFKTLIQKQLIVRHNLLEMIK